MLMLQYLLVFVAAVQAQDFIDMLVKQPGCLRVTIEKKCPNKNVTYWLYNNKVDNYQLNDFDISTIRQAPFNDGPIKILLHGYTGNKDYSPNTQIRPHYLRLNYNVISVDYGPVVKEPCYLQSVPNAETVADCFTDFIHLLLNTTIEKRASKKIVVGEIHVIGFSLGGQVSGDMGHKLQKKYRLTLPRITALDPAAPLFYMRDTKVNKTSATLVDCLHINSAMFGKLLPVATADFFFNFIIAQKGCSPIDLSCNHGRAPEYFAESIAGTDTKFCGRRSLKALCNSTGAVLVGEYMKPTTQGAYYVVTNRSPPYARDSKDAC